MEPLTLFIDGSVHPPTHVGFGAYFVGRADEFTEPPPWAQIVVKRFEPTTAARLELATLLWALEDLGDNATNVKIYTDSQTIVGLIGRRERLERTDFRSSAGRLLSNHDLYRAFYKAWDQGQFSVTKLEGHMRSADASITQQIFARVDQAARRALRDARCGGSKVGRGA